ncbi:hypothetical protein ABH988_000269 [Bradyrhizobium ottawaense]
MRWQFCSFGDDVRMSLSVRTLCARRRRRARAFVERMMRSPQTCWKRRWSRRIRSEPRSFRATSLRSFLRSRHFRRAPNLVCLLGDAEIAPAGSSACRMTAPASHTGSGLLGTKLSRMVGRSDRLERQPIWMTATTPALRPAKFAPPPTPRCRGNCTYSDQSSKSHLNPWADDGETATVGRIGHRVPASDVPSKMGNACLKTGANTRSGPRGGEACASVSSLEQKSLNQTHLCSAYRD